MQTRPIADTHRHTCMLPVNCPKQTPDGFSAPGWEVCPLWQGDRGKRGGEWESACWRPLLGQRGATSLCPASGRLTEHENLLSLRLSIVGGCKRFSKGKRAVYYSVHSKLSEGRLPQYRSHLQYRKKEGFSYHKIHIIFTGN